MSNGFIGYNPDQAKRDLEKFYEAMKNIDLKYRNSVVMFVEKLRSHWGSPRAVEFSKTKFNVFPESFQFFQNSTQNIIDSAVRAIQILAQNNGSYFDCNLIFKNEADEYDFHLEANVDLGNAILVGMDIPNVVFAIQDFEEDLSNVISMLNNLNCNLAVYDTTGDLVVAYQTQIKNMVNNIYDLLSNIKSELEFNIDIERQNLDSAVKESADLFGFNNNR